MKNIIYPKSRTVRELRKWVPFAGGGGKSEPDGREEVFYEVSIDLTLLEMMAHKAATNSTGKSFDGPLVVRVLNRARISEGGGK